MNLVRRVVSSMSGKVSDILLQTATGTDDSWCTDQPINYMNATNYYITGVSSSVNEKSNTVSCSVEKLVLMSPSTSDTQTKGH